MGSHTAKVKKEMALTEVSGFLRKLADVLDGSADGFDGGADINLRDFDKIEIKMKREMTAVSMKMKIEHDETASETAPDDGQEKPRYKKLKKRMQTTYKAIGKALSESRLPDQLTVQSFLRDALIMISYPGYGDEYYELFAQACERFSQACDGRDLSAVQAAFTEIVQLKEDCHDRYD